ncbi:hypothetical protein D3C81_1716220 [compost metagenome]
MFDRHIAVLQRHRAGIVRHRSRQTKAQLCCQQFAATSIRQQYRATFTVLTNGLGHHIRIIFDHTVIGFTAEQPDMVGAQLDCCRTVSLAQYERVD